MATSNDWINLGMAPQQAYRQNFTPTVTSASGSALSSAKSIGGAQYFTVVTSGTSALALPTVNSDTGALLGDQFIIANLTAASISLFAPATSLGSSTTLYGGAVSASGTTGTVIPTGYMALCFPFSVSSWTVGIASV